VSRAVYLKGARDAGVGLIELCEGQLGRSRRGRFVAAISIIFGMAASVQRSSPSRSFRATNLGLSLRRRPGTRPFSGRTGRGRPQRSNYGRCGTRRCTLRCPAGAS